MSESIDASAYPSILPPTLWISDSKARRDMTPEELAEQHRKDRETYRRMRERMAVDPEYREARLAVSRETTRRHREKNKDSAVRLERRRQVGRESYARRKDKLRERRRAEYKGERAEVIRARNRDWYARNRERRRDYNKAYREKNGDAIRARDREKQRLEYEQDPKKFNDYQKEWRSKNPERSRLYVRISGHRRRVAAAGTSFTKEEWLALVAQYDGRCAYCGEEKPLHMEHKIPLSRGGTNDISNIVPACQRCNNKKRSMTDVEFRERLAREAQITEESSGTGPGPGGSAPAG